MKLHYTIICDCDGERINDCRVTDLCHIALGFCVTDAPASASAFLPASRPLIPPNGGCHLNANLNAPTTKLPHLAKLIPVRRAPFPTASRLVLGPRGPGASPPSYTTTASFNHRSLIWLYKQKEYIEFQVDTFADDAFHAVFSVAQWEEVEHRIDGMTSRAKPAAQCKGGGYEKLEVYKCSDGVKAPAVTREMVIRFPSCMVSWRHKEFHMVIQMLHLNLLPISTPELSSSTELALALGPVKVLLSALKLCTAEMVGGYTQCLCGQGLGSRVDIKSRQRAVTGESSNGLEQACFLVRVKLWPGLKAAAIRSFPRCLWSGTRLNPHLLGELHFRYIVQASLNCAVFCVVFCPCTLLVGRGWMRSHPSPANSHQSGPMLEPQREEAIAHSTGAHSPSTQGGTRPFNPSRPGLLFFALYHGGETHLALKYLRGEWKDGIDACRSHSFYPGLRKRNIGTVDRENVTFSAL
ncbi:hypothetical protein FQN60_013670 [Etheostoma spectabile]|uniref:Uncharacterized protein n=1 Tax=Etheostoma spectabile TaxID=54343 RepID=A0A5J5CFI6_9PERO|nr:hypothetical protein FQN60_013670 [Etheostoma spectabile]